MNDKLKGVLLAQCKGVFQVPPLERDLASLLNVILPEYRSLSACIKSDLISDGLLNDFVDLTDAIIRIRRHLRLEVDTQVELHQNLTDQLIAREIDANG